MHIWLGTFGSREEFEKYLNQRKCLTHGRFMTMNLQPETRLKVQSQARNSVAISAICLKSW